MRASAEGGRLGRTGRFANGIEYLVLGDGPRSMVWLPGGPGSELPGPWQQRLTGLRQLADAGFTVWVLTRRRGMPEGHTVADMADDVAEAIVELGGRVDVVVGLSYGGMIAQYLAAEHPDRVDRVVLAMAACEVSPLVKAIDLRMATALSAGDGAGVAEAGLAYLLPSERAAPVRRAVARLLGPLVGGEPRGADPLIEGRAEEVFDARPVLPTVRVPVLVLVGDRDLAFSPEVAAETARLIPGSTLRWYRGKGHLRAASSRRLPRDILAFAGPDASAASPPSAPGGSPPAA
jgi:pimeloyl-ACP methyl ester carboxylesterase